MSINADGIKHLPLFKEMPDHTLEAVARVCVPRTFNKKEIVYLRGGAGGRVFLIRKGEVELYLASRGARIAIQVFREGDFFGDLSFASHPTPFPQEEYAQTGKETEVCVIQTADMLRLLETNALFTMALLVNLRNRLYHAESKIRDLAISEAPTRVLNELIRHAVSHGKEEGGLYEVGGRQTHQQIADLTGLARETVTKTLGLLEEQGFIAYTPLRMLRLHIKKITEECVGCIGLLSMRSGASS